MTISNFHKLIDKNEINLFHFVTSNEINPDTLILRDITKDNQIDEDVVEKLFAYIKNYCQNIDLHIEKSTFLDKASAQGLKIIDNKVFINLNGNKKFDLIIADSVWSSVRLIFKA